MLIHGALSRPDVLYFQMLGCLAVDTVYPAAGFYRMKNLRMRDNEDILKRLSEGKSFGEGHDGLLSAGSHAEGLAMDGHWGHGKSDNDLMFLAGGDLGVRVLLPGQQPSEDAVLVYTPQKCQPAYTRLQVLQKERLLSAIAKHICRRNVPVSAPEVQQCVFSEGGQLWLHSRHTLEAKQFRGTEAISGPAGQADGGLFDIVHSLVCSGPHPAMAFYMERPRKHWPSKALLDTLAQQPMLLVMVGPKNAKDSYLIFRMSWTTLELLLISSLALWLKQGYVCFKYTVKFVLKSLRLKDSAGDGHSRVGSYHLKTLFLRHLEEHPPQQEGSPFQLMLDLCQDLQHYLLMGCLPHYFFPEWDLLHTVGDEERQCALQAVGQVIADPLVAILLSPSEPKVICGGQSPNDIIRCFRDVATLPSCQKRHEDFQRLLCHLDAHREVLHREQLERDRHRVSGRPEPTMLADYLHGNL